MKSKTERILVIPGTPTFPKLDRPPPPSERRPRRFSMNFKYAFRTCQKSTIWPQNVRWHVTKCLKCECHSHFETGILLVIHTCLSKPPKYKLEPVWFWYFDFWNSYVSPTKKCTNCPNLTFSHIYVILNCQFTNCHKNHEEFR